jgi:hypothetical protein
MRRTVTTLLETLGFCLIAAGFWLISPVAGLIAAGIVLILIGVLAA